MSQNFSEFYSFNETSMYINFFSETEATSCIFNSTENLIENKKESPIDPFSKECKIPLPTWIQNQTFYDNSSFIRKRNERERARVKNVNEGFERLRKHLPISSKEKEKRLSKVETLRLAITYIQQLNSLLKFEKAN